MFDDYWFGVADNIADEKVVYECGLLNLWAELYMIYDDNEKHMYQCASNNDLEFKNAEELTVEVKGILNHLLSCGCKYEDIIKHLISLGFTKDCLVAFV